jgi:hypothetical protein
LSRSVRIGNAVGLEFHRVLLPLRDDGDDLAAFGGDGLVRSRQGIDVDVAIGAPVPAMKGDGDRSRLQHLFKAYESVGFVRQEKRGHRVPLSRSGLASAVLAQSLDQPIDRRGEGRQSRMHRRSAEHR